MSASRQMPRCVQFFGAHGECLIAPADAPFYCVAVAKTAMGNAVCNRGCGFSFAAGPPLERFRVFDCPFGVSNAILAIRQKDPGAADDPGMAGGAGAVGGPQPVGKAPALKCILVGGRVFRDYAQFRTFVDKAIEAGADAGELVEGCESLRFEDPGVLRSEFEEIAAAGAPVLLSDGSNGSDKSDQVDRVDQANRANNLDRSDKSDRFDRSDQSNLSDRSDSSAQSPRKRLSARHHGDVLTRYAFERRFRMEIERSERFRHPLSLALIRANVQAGNGDSAGREDKPRPLVRKGLGGFFRPEVRLFDLVANYEAREEDSEASETLALMFPETTRSDAERALDRVLFAVRNRFPSRVEEPENGGGGISFEIGIAEYPTDGMMFRELLETAKSGLGLAPLDVDLESESAFEKSGVDDTDIPDAGHEGQDAASEPPWKKDDRA